MNKSASNGVKLITKKIRNTLYVKDNRILLENLISLSLLQMVNYVMPLVTLPYLAKIIGVDKFGEIAFSSALIVYFQTVVDYGFNYTATRDIAKNRNDMGKVSEIYSNVMWSRIILMLLSFLLLCILIFVIPDLRAYKTLLFFSFLLIPGHVFFPEWLFQGLERMKYITILNVLSKTVFTVAVFFVIREKSDYIYQPLLISSGFCLSGVISMYVIHKKWHITFAPFSYKEVLNTIRQSSDVFINQLFPNLYNSFSVLLLGVAYGSEANGLLDSGSKLANASQQFLTVISRVFYPYLSRNMDKHTIFSRCYILLSVVVSVLLFVFAEALMKLLFTSEYMSSVSVLRIISVSNIFISVSSVYGTNYLIITGREHILRNITMFSSVIGFICAFPLVYLYSYIGAASVIFLTRLLLASGTILYYNKYKNI